jgi:hypothetical protein
MTASEANAFVAKRKFWSASDRRPEAPALRGCSSEPGSCMGARFSSFSTATVPPAWTPPSADERQCVETIATTRKRNSQERSADAHTLRPDRYRSPGCSLRTLTTQRHSCSRRSCSAALQDLLSAASQGRRRRRPAGCSVEKSGTRREGVGSGASKLPYRARDLTRALCGKHISIEDGTLCLMRHRTS